MTKYASLQVVTADPTTVSKQLPFPQNKPCVEAYQAAPCKHCLLRHELVKVPLSARGSTGECALRGWGGGISWWLWLKLCDYNKGPGSFCGWGPPEQWKHCIIQRPLQLTRNQDFLQRALAEGESGS